MIRQVKKRMQTATVKVEPTVRPNSNSLDNQEFCDDPKICGKSHWDALPAYLQGKLENKKIEILNAEIFVKEILPFKKRMRIEDAVSIGIAHNTVIQNTAYTLVSPKKRSRYLSFHSDAEQVSLHELLRDKFSS